MVDRVRVEANPELLATILSEVEMYVHRLFVARPAPGIFTLHHFSELLLSCHFVFRMQDGVYVAQKCNNSKCLRGFVSARVMCARAHVLHRFQKRCVHRVERGPEAGIHRFNVIT